MDNADQLSRRALLVATSSATLAAVLLGPRGTTASAQTATTGARGAAGSTGTTPVGAATALISLTATASGRFSRVRAVDDDTRLYLTYPAAAGNLTGQQVTAPGYYGLDFAAYPAGQQAAQYLQDLFDNTPFGYLGFYFTTTGHPAQTGSWTGKAVGLLRS